MSKAIPIRRIAAAAAAALALGIGSAVWATSSASAAPVTTSAASMPSMIPPVCTSANLAVWVDFDAMNGAAGTWYYPLEFTNVSDHTCRTWGWPGVSATNAIDKQLGAAAARNNLYAPEWVNIPAGGTAHALLGYGAAEVSTSGCKPRIASLLKVFAPNQKRADHAFFDLPACTIAKRHRYLTVSAIRPGTNI